MKAEELAEIEREMLEEYGEESPIAFELDPSQRLAVDLVKSAPIAVVTGGAGTGKTTILRRALDELDEAESFRMDFENIGRAPYLLASPTGKAARRLAEATGREASTVHRLLGWRPPGDFGAEPLEAGLVVIDEASMLDVELASALLRAIDPERTRIVFVGDANQLPSVGPGKFFADLIASGAVPVAELATVHRAAGSSWMVGEAPKIIRGEAPSLEPSDSFDFVELDDASSIASAIEGLAVKYASQGRESQVLSPQSTTPIGVDALNVLLQSRLTPAASSPFEWKTRAGTLRLGDRVLQTSNDYSRDVFNGETGVVVGLAPVSLGGKNTTELLVDFGGAKPVRYDREASKALRLAYAMSIHKSQGSQYDVAIVVCHSSHTHMLSRQLLYTAVTRASGKVVLVGNRKGLAAALKDTSPSKRNTELAELLREGMERVA